MKPQDSPFAALDKRLFASPQIKKPVQANDAPSLPQDQAKPASSSPTTHQVSPGVSKPDSNHGITTPRHHNTTVSPHQEEILDKVRKAVKQLGKEAATHRFTPEEKSRIAEIVYTCRTKGIKTSENEITRISINYLLLDYRENGAASLLARILDKLNA